MDPLLVAGLKVASSKEGGGAAEDGRVTVARSSGRISFCLFWGVEASVERFPGLYRSMHHWRGNMSVSQAVLLLLLLPLSFYVFHPTGFYNPQQ